MPERLSVPPRSKVFSGLENEMAPGTRRGVAVRVRAQRFQSFQPERLETRSARGNRGGCRGMPERPRVAGNATKARGLREHRVFQFR
jgi:hypothetical protein